MKQGRPQGSAGGRAACHSDSGPGAGPPRGARRVSRRGPDRGPSGDGARRAGCALSLAGLRLGPRHRGAGPLADSHVVRYRRASAVGSVEAPSLLDSDAASHGPAGPWVLLRHTTR